MDHLESTPIDELHDALDSVEGKKPTLRLVTAIAFKHGVSQTELAEWFGVGRRTIYNWLTRIDTDDPLREAVRDDHRSGRNRKLPNTELEEVRETLREPPSKAGYDRPAWTTKLVRDHLEETHHVEYSLPSCRRLLKEAGLVYREARHANAKGDPENRDTADQTRAQRTGRWVPQ